MSDAAPPTSSRRGWPQRLIEIADAIGDAAALRLVASFGGQRVYIAKHAAAGQLVADAIGVAEADALARRFGGEELEVPRAAALRSRKAAILDTAGSSNVVARQLGVTERYVRMTRNAGGAGPDASRPADDRQGSLFGDA